MKIETINIKEGYPPADVAVANMEIEIEAHTFAKTGVLKVIHGYGSHGVGGEIKRQVLVRLAQLKKNKKISDYIPAERFGELQKNSEFILSNFPELILDDDLKNYNSGITLVFLNAKK